MDMLISRCPLYIRVWIKVGKRPCKFGVPAWRQNWEASHIKMEFKFMEMDETTQGESGEEEREEKGPKMECWGTQAFGSHRKKTK